MKKTLSWILIIFGIIPWFLQGVLVVEYLIYSPAGTQMVWYTTPLLLGAVLFGVGMYVRSTNKTAKHDVGSKQ